jgi:LmbE family N-acetylglucosaminyl deacetylase
MRVLGVGAHPDDLEMLCGGTLALYARRGDTVIMASACTGDRDDPAIPPQEMARIRDAEARAAASVIGAQYLCLGFSDETVFPSEENCLRFVDLIRQARPDLIITHGPGDYHIDHLNTGQLTFWASTLATVTHIRTAHPPAPVRPPIYHMDNVACIGFLPTEYVDISDVIAQKKDMLSQHRSQIHVFGDTGLDLLDQMLTMSRLRGYQCEAAYAEGFRRLDIHRRIPVQRLLP